MALGLSKARYSPIAIDFGADSLKLLQVVASDPPQFVAAASIELPDHARRDAGSRHAFYADSLKLLLKCQPFKGRRAICAIPAYQTLVQHLQIPRVPASEVDDQVAVQLRQRLNLEPTRMVMRVHPVPREGQTKQEVICLAAHRDAVMRYIECAHRAKLDVVGMHCEPQAIIQAFEYLYRREGDEDRTTCFVDIGAATTKVVISHGNTMVFSKTIHAAGDHLTRHFAQQKNLKFIEARAARIELAEQSAIARHPGVQVASGDEPADRRREHEEELVFSAAQASASASGGAKAGTHGAHASAAQRHGGGPGSGGAGDSSEFGDAMECLIDELRMCLRYHETMFPGRGIEKLVFLGGEARHLNICQTVARSLGVGAQLGDPLARLVKVGKTKGDYRVDLSAVQPGFAVAYGLCLSDVNL